MAEDARWAVITGASSGIGAELARIFAARGYSLVVAARRHERLEALAEEIQGAHDIPVEVMALDLEDREAPQDLVEMLRDRGIQVHTLVNNAGFGLRGTFATMPFERQIAMIDVNVTALTALCRLLLPGMLERGRGGILNVASTAAFQAGPYMGVYYATKAYVLSLSEALHEEAKPHGVTVTALCPGPTESEFSSTADLENTKRFTQGAMSAAQVARIGIDGYEAGRAIVVAGASNRLGTLGAKLLPRAVIRRIAGTLQRGEVTKPAGDANEEG
ncbi:SDR family NAD(P)-dependent oxidoreductase [Microvirga makkahensis]|uniref:SDR family NAD(P)-dependent oxidoreductase n=1 Tax=Microvirga makkahensis TaxID=1128670 RepID=A0A7X3MNF7_9HYPH|nr:SDR family oxidoreductase [Microvirga makkahensis]MXQ10306.1 SDR family NAD(P)-dependent oxidoreductase [Microvirga makkahensis]